MNAPHPHGGPNDVASRPMGDRGGRAAARLWARHELRARWRSVLVLGLLTGLAAAVSLAALAGARRSATAFDRLRDATDAADAVIFASQVDIFAPDWEPIAELPYVEAAGSFGITFAPIVEGPPGKDLENIGYFTVPYGGWRTEIDRPVIVEGRAPDPNNPYEVLASPEGRDVGIEVGQEYVIALPSEEQVANVDLFSEPEGERVTVRVVGFGTSTFERAVIPVTDGDGFVTTPAFDDRYSSPSTFIDNLLVRFKPGQGSVAELEADARRIFDSPKLPVLDTSAVSKRITNGTDLEATGLAMFGVAVALAASVLIGQALTRSVRAGAADAPTLRSMGFTRRNLARAQALPHLPVVAVGALVGFVGAVALSPRFPIGLSRSVDPDVGVHVDWLVLGAGLALMIVVLVVTIALTARRATAPMPATRPTRRSKLVALLTSLGAHPPVTLGASLALEPGRDRRALPTRPALAGIAVGVLGVVGAQTLLAGMNDAIDNPARFGAVWDVETFPEDTAGLDGWEAAMDVVDGTDGVVESAMAARGLIVIDGVTQPAYAITPRVGSIEYTVLDGRRPVAPGEIALGPATAGEYGVSIGDTVTATGADDSETQLEVVGTVLLPTTPHSSYDQGAWLALDELEALAGAPVGELAPGADEFDLPPVVPRHLAVLDDPARRDEVALSLIEQFEGQLIMSEPATEPIDINSLRNVRSLPVLFAVFTTMLALGTVAHVCVSTVRRRGTDLAVLRALGMTPHNTRAVLAWQATTLSVLGLLVGLPLGVIVGRTVWRVIADVTPLLFVAPLAGLVLVLAVPITFAAANALALVPARRAARIRPAELLHTE